MRNLLVETQTDMVEIINSNDYSMQVKIRLLTIYRFRLKNLRDILNEIEYLL